MPTNRADLAEIERKAKGLRKSSKVKQMLREGRSLGDIDTFLFDAFVEKMAGILAQTEAYWKDKKRAAGALRPQLQATWSKISSTQH